MAKLKVGILISGRGSNMAALIEAAKAADYPAEIACVASNVADAPGLKIAQAAGIATTAPALATSGAYVSPSTDNVAPLSIVRLSADGDLIFAAVFGGHSINGFSSCVSSAWFDCSVDHTKDLDVCRVWDDEGHLIAYGNYRLDGETRAATTKELRPSMVHLYPGHPDLAWIYLSGDNGDSSKTLIPVNDAGQPLERFEVHVQTGGER